MEEKIKLVAPYLPTLLLETKQIYGVLSKGVHVLEEQECLSSFSNAKLVIELILDEHLLQLEKEQRIVSAKTELDSF